MSVISQVSGILKKYPLAIICFVIFVTGGVLTSMRGGQLTELENEEQELNARDRVIKRNVRNAIGIKEELERVQTVVEAMQSKLFRREERAVNANFFYDMETPFDVRITQISQQGGDHRFYTQGGIHELKLHSTTVFSIGLVGQIENILSFVHQLKEVDPFVRVTNISLAMGNQNQGAGFLQCSLSLVVLSELEKSQ